MKIRLQEICIIGFVISVIILAICGYMLRAVTVEKDLITEVYHSTQTELNVAEANIESSIQDNMKLKDELESLGRQIEDMNDEIMKVEKELVDYKKESANYFINRYELSDDELEMMYKLVEAEVTGFGMDEKLNVAYTVINRVYSDSFPDTVVEVIFQHRQFSCIYDQRYFNVKITQSTIDAVNYAIRSEDKTGNALYFMNPSGSDESNIPFFYNKLDRLFEDGSGHVFFTEKED